MIIQPEQLRIEFSEPPRVYSAICQRQREEYRIKAFDESIETAHLVILRDISNVVACDGFWFDLSTTPPKSRFVVKYQRTEPEYRGQGISGFLICQANEYFKSRFNQTLASDDLFAIPEAERVWQKLESAGLARFEPLNLKSRWIML